MLCRINDRVHAAVEEQDNSSVRDEMIGSGDEETGAVRSEAQYEGTYHIEEVLGDFYLPPAEASSSGALRCNDRLTVIDHRALGIMGRRRVIMRCRDCLGVALDVQEDFGVAHNDDDEGSRVQDRSDHTVVQAEGINVLVQGSTSEVFVVISELADSHQRWESDSDNGEDPGD